MGDFSSEELAKRTHTHLNTYITSADQKASILLTALFAFLGFYGSGVGAVWQDASLSFKLLSGLTIGSGLIGALFAGLVIYPRSPQGEEDGLMFWESITSRDQSTFVSEVTSLNDDAALEEIIKQNHTLAEVADGKYKYTRCALIATAVSVGFAMASAGSYFLY